LSYDVLRLVIHYKTFNNSKSHITSLVFLQCCCVWCGAWACALRLHIEARLRVRTDHGTKTTWHILRGRVVRAEG